MSLMVAQEVPTSSTMALPHGPTGVAEARRKLRGELCARDVPEPVIDDAVLILSELLSNSCRHARPLGDCDDGPGGDGCGIRAAWMIGDDGLLAVEVTDGGGPTRPRPASPSLTAHGGRGLGIVGSLALRWGVRDDAPGEVTVWALLPVRGRHARRDERATVGSTVGSAVGSALGSARGSGRGGLPMGIPLDLPLDLAESLDDLG